MDITTVSWVQLRTMNLQPKNTKYLQNKPKEERIRIGTYPTSSLLLMSDVSTNVSIFYLVCIHVARIYLLSIYPSIYQSIYFYLSIVQIAFKVLTLCSKRLASRARSAALATTSSNKLGGRWSFDREWKRERLRKLIHCIVGIDWVWLIHRCCPTERESYLSIPSIPPRKEARIKKTSNWICCNPFLENVLTLTYSSKD